MISFSITKAVGKEQARGLTISRLGIYLGFAAVFLVFSLLSPYFLTVDNILNIMSNHRLLQSLLAVKP